MVSFIEDLPEEFYLPDHDNSEAAMEARAQVRALAARAAEAECTSPRGCHI